MKRLGWIVCLLAASLIFAPIGTSWAQNAPIPASAIGPNVRLKITIVDSDPGTRPAEQTHEFVARSGGEPSTLLMGWRVPIPTTQSGDDGEPVTEYVYQNIGFTAKLMVSMLDDGQILVRGDLEASGARKGPQELRDAAEDGDLPIFGTFQQSLNVTLKEGKPLRLAEVPDPDGGRLHVELVADVLD